MRATPTPRQRHALDTLGYVAPLLRLMRCEVARVVWTMSVGGGLGPSSFLLGPGGAPPGLWRLVADATFALTAHWLADRGDEVAVNFDTATGMVDIHRHGDHAYPNATSTYWIADIALLDPPPFAQRLGPLFTGTLDVGGAAVLADWFEEQPGSWETLAGVLRTREQPHLPSPFDVHGFQYAYTSPDTACWQFRAWDEWELAGVKNEAWVLGLGVFGPDGLERAWHFLEPESLDPAFAEQFWRLCPAPPREAA